MSVSKVTLRKKYKEKTLNKINELQKEVERQTQKELDKKEEIKKQKELKQKEERQEKKELQKQVERQKEIELKKREEHRVERLQDIKIQITVYGTLILTLVGVFIMIVNQDVVEYYLLVSAGITALISVFFDNLFNSPKKISDATRVFQKKGLSLGIFFASLTSIIIFIYSLCEKNWVITLAAVFYIVLLLFLRIGIPFMEKYINKDLKK